MVTTKEKAALERAINNAVSRAQSTVNSKSALRIEAQAIAHQAASITAPPAAAAKAADAATQAAAVMSSLVAAQAEVAGIHRKKSPSTIGAAETKVTSLCQDAEVALGAAKALMKEATDLADEKAKIETTVSQVERLRDDVKNILDDLEGKAETAGNLASDAKKLSDKVVELRPGSQQATDAADAATESDKAAKAGRKVIDGDATATPPLAGVATHLSAADTELQKARDIRDGVVATSLATTELCLTNVRREKEAAQKLAETFPQHARAAQKGHGDVKAILDAIENITTVQPVHEMWLRGNWKSLILGLIAIALIAFIGWGEGLTLLVVLIAMAAVIASILTGGEESAKKMVRAAVILLVLAFFLDFSSIPFVGERITSGGQSAEVSQTECRTGWADDPCQTMAYKVANSPLYWLTIGIGVSGIVWLIANRNKLPTLWNSLRGRLSRHP